MDKFTIRKLATDNTNTNFRWAFCVNGNECASVPSELEAYRFACMYLIELIHQMQEYQTSGTSQ